MIIQTLKYKSKVLSSNLKKDKAHLIEKGRGVNFWRGILHFTIFEFTCSFSHKLCRNDLEGHKSSWTESEAASRICYSCHSWALSHRPRCPFLCQSLPGQRCSKFQLIFNSNYFSKIKGDLQFIINSWLGTFTILVVSVCVIILMIQFGSLSPSSIACRGCKLRHFQTSSRSGLWLHLQWWDCPTNFLTINITKLDTMEDTWWIFWPELYWYATRI